jgi:hypothetical protein
MKRLILALVCVVGLAQPAYAQLTTDLISFWSLEETGGTDVRDDAHGSNDLTPTGSTIVGASGLVGNAIDFEFNSGGDLRIASNSTVQTGDIAFTFVGWFNRESAAATVDGALITKQGMTNGEYGIWLDTVTQNLQFAAWGTSGYGSGGTVTNTTAIASDSTWYFFVAEHDPTANTLTLAINNGTPASTSHSAGAFVSTSTFRIGGGDFLNPWDGMVDQVGFWKRTLTTDEKTWLYNSGAGRTYAEIVAGMGGGAPSCRGLLLLLGAGC